MAYIFSLTFTAGPEHIDQLGHVNNSVWVQWMEELATGHWENHADPQDIDSYIWMVTRHEIDYRGNIKEGEQATGRTWIDTPPRGARFDRQVEFSDGSGKAIVTARTSWAMLDKETYRPVRIPQRLADQFLVTKDPE